MEKFKNLCFDVVEINLEGDIISCNSSFENNILPILREIRKESEPTEFKNINELIELVALERCSQIIKLKNQEYSLTLDNTQENQRFVLFNKIEIPKTYKSMVGLIFIDNYEEVLESVEDFKRPLLLALVDRKIKKMTKKIGGVIKSFEKDKYLFVASLDKLDVLKEKRFSILEEVQDIDMGNNMPLTLSIGLGVGGADFDENMEYARASIDLSLSRGGAQAVIKNYDNYEFFGGHSKEHSRNTRVRARVKAYAFSELIEDASNVIVMGHKNVDADCLGAAVGVKAIVSAFDKDCKIVLNDVTTSVKGLYDELVKEDKYEDTFINSETALNLIRRKTLIVVVDVFKKPICECPELLEKPNKIVVFDHHRKSVDCIDNAVLVYHETYASSTCELVTEMFMYINKVINIKPVEADAILAGVIVDTKNFAFKTGIKTFEIAAFLKKKGADTIRIKKLFRTDLDFYNAKSEIIKNMEVYGEHIAISTLEVSSENPILLIAQSCDELLNIEGIDASFVLCEKNNIINISARSFGDINTQIIMEKMGGGGHHSVAATQLQNTTISDAKIILKNCIDEYMREEE